MTLSHKICVGVPVFNEEGYVIDTVRSLKKQDLEARFLISDNASTDRTLEIINDLIQGDSRFELVRQPQNIGAIQNFQYLIENSSSEYFMWLGGHDFLSDNFLQPLVAILDGSPDVAIAAGTPWRVEEGQAPEPMPDATYDFSDSIPVNRYLKAVAELSNCTVLHSLFRRKHLENYVVPQALSWDKVFLSHLLWHGKLEFHSEARYFRRYFPARTENVRERLRGAGELSLAPMKDSYLEDFATLARPVLPALAYERHVRTITKLVLGGNAVGFERRFRQTTNSLTSIKVELAEAQAKARAAAEANNKNRKQLMQTKGKLQRVEKELAETKRMLDMTLVSRLLAVYRSFKAKRKLHRLAGSNAHGTASHPQ